MTARKNNGCARDQVPDIQHKLKVKVPIRKGVDLSVQTATLEPGAPEKQSLITKERFFENASQTQSSGISLFCHN